MKLFVTISGCRAFFTLANPKDSRLDLSLSEGTILLGGQMEEFERKMNNKFVFVISPMGEALFLPSRCVKEI